VSKQCGGRGGCLAPGVCACRLGYSGGQCEDLVGRDGATLRLLPSWSSASVSFVWGIQATPQRALLSGKPLSASPDPAAAALLPLPASQARIAALCRELELSPPWRVRPGSVRCPMLTLQRARLAASRPFPVPPCELLEALAELAARYSWIDSHVGVAATPLAAATALAAATSTTTATPTATSGPAAPAAPLGASADGAPASSNRSAFFANYSLSWLSASMRTNVLAEGGPSELREMAAWFEGVSVTFNAEATAAFDADPAATGSAATGSAATGSAAAGSATTGSAAAGATTAAAAAAATSSVAPTAGLVSWQASSSWIWMEALEEAVVGTAGCILSGSLLTMATLLLFTCSIRLAGATILGVLVVLVAFIGYLSARGYALGVVEAVATTIFIGFACDYCVHVLSVAEHTHRHAASAAAAAAAAASAASASAAAATSASAPASASYDAAPRLPLSETLGRAAPSLYGAALTTVAAAAPLLFCRVLLFQQMGEFIVVCTSISLLCALTLIAPLAHVRSVVPAAPAPAVAPAVPADDIATLPSKAHSNAPDQHAPGADAYSRSPQLVGIIARAASPSEVLVATDMPRFPSDFELSPCTAWMGHGSSSAPRVSASTGRRYSDMI
jgi:hypothetical protein